MNLTQIIVYEHRDQQSFVCFLIQNTKCAHLCSCLVVILANTPMESNGQGRVRMLFSHVCLGLSV